jgi:hypothetical protein
MHERWWRLSFQVVCAGGIVVGCFTSFPELADEDAAGASGGQSSGGAGGLGDGSNLDGAAGKGPDAGSDAASETGMDASIDTAPDVPVIPGLLGHWPFDDGSGSQATDIVAGNHALIPSADITWTTSGVLGGALAFDEPMSGITVTQWDDAAFPQIGTLSVWLKVTVIPNDTSSRNVFDSHNTTRNHLFVRRANGSPEIALQCAFQPTGQPYAFVETTPIASGEWQLVAVGWSSAEGFCYINGTRLTDTVAPGWAPSEQKFVLGQHLGGVMDDLRLYDHMLSNEELAQLQAAGP